MTPIRSSDANSSTSNNQTISSEITLRLKEKITAELAKIRTAEQQRSNMPNSSIKALETYSQELSNIYTAFISSILQRCKDPLIKDLEDHGIDTKKLSECPSEEIEDAIDPFLRSLAAALQMPNPKSASIQECKSHIGQILKNNIKLCEQANDSNRKQILAPFRLKLLKSHDIGSDDTYITITQAQLAIILNELPLLYLMIEKQYVLSTETCSQGYTLSHIAALFKRTDMLIILYKFNARFDTICGSGATVYDLLHAQGLTRPFTNIQLNIFKTKTCDTAAFYETFGRHYCSSIQHTSAALFQLWLQKSTPTEMDKLPRIYQYVLEQYQHIKTSRALFQPELYVEKVDSTSHPLHNQWKLCAKRTISAGTFLAEHTGIASSMHTPATITTGLFTQKSCFDLQINSSFKGNIASFANHGPPNCAQFHVCLKGQIVALIYALREIQEGEELFYDYYRPVFENNNIPFFELGKPVIDTFISMTLGLRCFKVAAMQRENYLRIDCIEVNKGQVATTSVMMRSPSANQERKILFEIEYDQAMMRYLYENPDYLIECIKLRKFTKEQVQGFLAAYEKMLHDHDIALPETYHSNLKEKIAAADQHTASITTNGSIESLTLAIDKLKLSNQTSIHSKKSYQPQKNLLHSHLDSCEECFKGDLHSHGIDPKKLIAASIQSHDLDTMTPHIQWFSHWNGFDINSIALTLQDNYNKKITEPFIFVAEKERVYVLTQLQCALMIQKSDLALKMIETNPDCISERGSYGYTNAHFAAIFRNYQVLVALHGKGADLEASCATGANVYDILAAQGLSKMSESIVSQPDSTPTIACFEIGLINSSFYKKTFGRDYCTSTIHSSAALFSLWRQGLYEAKIETLDTIEKDIFTQFLQKKYSKNETNPYYAKKIQNAKPQNRKSKNSSARKSNVDPTISHMEGEYKICARHDIPAGTFIMSVDGDVVTNAVPLTSKQDYSFDPALDPAFDPTLDPVFPSPRIDTQKRGGLAALINDGPPNLREMTVIERGRVQILLYTTTHVKKDEELLLDYSKRFFCDEQISSIELSPQAIDKIVSDTNKFTNVTTNVFTSDKTLILHTATISEQNTVTKDIQQFSFATNRERDDRLLTILHEQDILFFLYYHIHFLMQRITNKSITPEEGARFLQCYELIMPPGQLDNETHKKIKSLITLRKQMLNKNS